MEKNPKCDKIVPVKNSFFFSKPLEFKNGIVCSGENPKMPKIVVGSTHSMAETIIEVHKYKLNEW